MARRSEGVSRSEVTEKVARHREGLDEQGREIDETVSDIETIRGTSEELDLAGTSEAVEEIEGAIERAEALSVDEFKQESERLEGVQKEGEEHVDELQERSDSATADLGRLSDAGGNIARDAASRLIDEATRAAERDIAFLGELAKRALADLEESRRQQEVQDSRVGK